MEAEKLTQFADSLVEGKTVSESVLQLTVDYLFVRERLLNAGAPVLNDFGHDIALSIVSDAYNNEARKYAITLQNETDRITMQQSDIVDDE